MLKDVHWDKNGWNTEMQKETIDVVFGRIHAEAKVGLAWIMWCNPLQVGEFANLFQSKGFTKPRLIYWHKRNYNTEGDKSEYLSAVEVCMLTFYEIPRQPS